MAHDDPKLTETSEIERVLDLASAGHSLLVTGRAGTGKSTLLRRVRADLENSGKVVSLVAPTGIAALNVGGETLHRHFAFRANLLASLRNYRPPAHLEETDVLVIDEISMVRADYFDMMSRALSRVRNSPDPFGGCQVIMFGDLFQLPPVVTDRDRAALTDYQTPFFFSSRAFTATNFEAVELTTVFRQRGDEAFIRLLNAVRESSALDATLESLNTRVAEDDSTSAQPRVTLVPSNRRANEINRRELSKLETPVHTWEAKVTGDISLDDYKVEPVLEFAVGAQVMMAANTDEFVNGTMGVITDIHDGDEIRVTVDVGTSGDSHPVIVEPHTWEIWRKTREESVLVGSIEQLPFRLAWALTIHRSQGQTFECVVFDRDRGMFADGQLYVALSRCRSLSGLTLRRPLTPRDVRVNDDVLRFYRSLSAPLENVAIRPHAYVGFLGTGNDEFGRLLEVAIVAYDGEEEAFRFSTLLNPMRDFALPNQGPTPSTVTLAPTIDEARAALAMLLNGRIIVTHQANRLQDLLSLKKVATDEGLWVDVDQLGDAEESESRLSTALEAVEHVREVFRIHGANRMHPAVPVGQPGGEVQPGLTFLDRHGFTSAPPSAKDALRSPATTRLLVAVLAGATSQTRSSLLEQLDAATREGLRPAVQDALNALVKSALRDGRLAPQERERIEWLANAFDLPSPDLPDSEVSDEPIELHVGQRVCLTGKGLNKAESRLLLEEHGLLETDRVTKSQCDLVVAENASSQSVKARAARNFGIPVISLEDFEELLEQGVTDTPETADLKQPVNGASLGLESQSMDPAAIRDWARSTGLKVGDRGRIPLHIRDAYISSFISEK